MDAMMEMGGELLGDAGQMLSDAGAGLQDGGSGGTGGGRDALIDGAEAQMACDSCTAGQRQMIVTADQDLAQLRGGTIERAGWSLSRGQTSHGSICNVDLGFYAHTAQVADGPLVLTDAYVRDHNISLFTVPRGQPCYAMGASGIGSYSCGGAGMQDYVAPPTVQQPPEARSLFVATVDLKLTGARIVIGAEETLCAFVLPSSQQAIQPTDSPSTNAKLLWSGFEPYE